MKKNNDTYILIRKEPLRTLGITEKLICAVYTDGDKALKDVKKLNKKYADKGCLTKDYLFDYDNCDSNEHVYYEIAIAPMR